MRIVRPVWLTHSGVKDNADAAVYSVHVSPDGKRIVTAGGDGFVRIWSTEATYNADDPSYSKPRQLASMSYHAGTIHAVRFSGSGAYLASGADDKNVCIYKFDPTAPPAHSAAFGSGEAPAVENWKIVRRLIGHDNDVQDLGWSQDSSILVSVGLDSKIVVWSGYTFEKLKTLVGHQSHVKGLTFDPANKYFATASDDRTIKIWRFLPPGPNSGAHDQINNFILEKTITQPFKASPLTTYFRRCSWSPDGMHIATANAVNGPVSSVAIVDRGSWDGDIHLIGHEGPVEVCAFSPRIFSNHPQDQAPVDPSQQAAIHSVIACAGQDKSLTIWITAKARPLVIVKDISKKSVSDLAWTPDGKTLYVACLDGTILMVRFEDTELGWEISVEENEKGLAKFGTNRRGAGMVEGTDGLVLEDLSKEGEMRGAEGRMGALMGDTVQAPMSNGDATLTNGTNGVSKTQEAEVERPAVIPEKPKEDTTVAMVERLKSKVTIGKDGKKRVAPTLVSSAQGNTSSLPRPQLLNSKANLSNQNDQPQSILDLSKPFEGLPQGGLASLLLGNRRRNVPGGEDDTNEKRIAVMRRDGLTPIVTNTVDGLALAKATSSPSGQQITPEFLRPAVTNPSLTVSQVRLAVPKLRSHIVRNLTSTGASKTTPKSDSTELVKQQAEGNEVILEVRNPTHPPPSGRPQDQEPARVVVTKRGQPIFQDYLPRSALLVTGNKDFWSVACEDGTIYAWTPMGRRLLNAMVLESQPVILDCQSAWLLCITAVGLCYVWDMRSLTSPHPPVSLAPVLDIAMHGLQDHPTRGPALTGARLNSEGRIVVTLTNGEGFAYNPSMFVWQRLSELWWMVGSQYWNSTDSSVGDLKSNTALGDGSTVSAGVIPFLERSTTNATLARGRAGFLNRLVKQLITREGFEGLESGVSVAHLENRLAAAMMLGAKDDFQVYLYMYARRIGAEGLKLKVEELLRGLLGGIFGEPNVAPDQAPPNASNDRYWNDQSQTLCGWPRKELMKGVVLILGKNRDLQRITVPYAKVLGVTNDADTNGDADAVIS